MKIILDFIDSIFIAVLCFFMFLNKYEIKKNRIIIKLICIIKMIILKNINIFFNIPIMNFIINLAICISIITFFYKCSILNILIYSFIYIIIIFISYYCSIFFDSVLCKYIFNWILVLILTIFTSLIIKKNILVNLKWYEIIFYMFLILFEIVFFIIVTKAVSNYINRNFLIVVMIGLMILDICVMILLSRISLLRNAEEKVNLMHQHEQLQNQMYKDLQKKYNQMCKISHDINRHISSLKTLIEISDNEKADVYFSELIAETKILFPAIKNQNLILEILLNITSEKCNEKNIEFTLDIEDFLMGFMSDMDMTIIFSNLLDNAVEACLDIPESQRMIKLIIKAQMGLIVIKVINSCCALDRFEEKPYHSTKKNHQGIGLSNVRNIVEKYDGIMNVKYEDNKFNILISFTNKL